MSLKRCCSLCCTSCIEYEFLQNDLGEKTKFYDVTVKYFDPMLLNDEQNLNSEHIQVLCGDCWFRINDFHEFQRGVLKTRILFEDKESVKFLSIEVKQENVEESETISTQNGEKFYIKEVNADYVENQYFKAESPKIVEYSHDERFFVAKEEAENLDNTPEDQDNLNASRAHTGTTSVTSYENTTKTPIEEPNEKVTPQQNKANNERECSEENKQKNIKTSQEIKDSFPNLKKARELDALIAAWKPELICDLCSETANNFDQLQSHFKEKHKVKFYIKCCEKKFYRRYVFANHIELHLDPDIHKCEICGKTSASKKDLKLHKKFVHDPSKQLKCNICEKRFKQKPTLTRHLLTHSTGSKDFICSECGKGFVAEKLLKLHFKQVHNSDRVCDQCGETIHGFRAYKQHLMKHAGIERVKFPCDVCGHKSMTSPGLKRHKESYHSDGSTAYVCEDCGKVSASENALLDHKRQVHATERRHKCTYCEKAFKLPKYLRDHVATHTGQKQFKCPYCAETFQTSSQMHRHRRKVHPVEWEESRKNHPRAPKININQETKQIVIC